MPKEKPSKPVPARIIPEDYVDLAEQLMKERYALISKTKMQNMLHLVCDIYNAENRRSDLNLLPESFSQIKLMRIRLAYECGRDPSVRQIVQDAKLLDYLVPLSSARTAKRQDLLDFYHYMEALVAFHRYYFELHGGNEQ